MQKQKQNFSNLLNKWLNSLKDKKQKRVHFENEVNSFYL